MQADSIHENPSTSSKQLIGRRGDLRGLWLAERNVNQTSQRLVREDRLASREEFQTAHVTCEVALKQLSGDDVGFKFSLTV